MPRCNHVSFHRRPAVAGASCAVSFQHLRRCCTYGFAYAAYCLRNGSLRYATARSLATGCRTATRVSHYHRLSIVCYCIPFRLVYGRVLFHRALDRRRLAAGSAYNTCCTIPPPVRAITSAFGVSYLAVMWFAAPPGSYAPTATVPPFRSARLHYNNFVPRARRNRYRIFRRRRSVLWFCRQQRVLPPISHLVLVTRSFSSLPANMPFDMMRSSPAATRVLPFTRAVLD